MIITNKKTNYPEYDKVIKGVKKETLDNKEKQKDLTETIKNLIPLVKNLEHSKENDFIYKKISKLCRVALAQSGLTSPEKCEKYISRSLSTFALEKEVLGITGCIQKEIEVLDVKNLIQEMLNAKIKELQVEQQKIINVIKRINQELIPNPDHKQEINAYNLKLELEQMNLKPEELKLKHAIEELQEINLDKLDTDEKKTLIMFFKEKSGITGQLKNVVVDGCLKKPTPENLECFIKPESLQFLTQEQKERLLDAGALKIYSKEEIKSFLETSFRTFLFQQLMQKNPPEKGCCEWFTKLFTYTYEATCKNYMHLLTKNGEHEVAKENLNNIVQLTNVSKEIGSAFLQVVCPEKVLKKNKISEEQKQWIERQNQKKNNVVEVIEVAPTTVVEVKEIVPTIIETIEQNPLPEIPSPLPKPSIPVAYSLDNFRKRSYIDLIIYKFYGPQVQLSSQQKWNRLPTYLKIDALRHVRFFAGPGIAEDVVREVFSGKYSLIKMSNEISSLQKRQTEPQNPLIKEGEQLAADYYLNDNRISFSQRLHAWVEKLNQEPLLKRKFFQSVYQVLVLSGIENLKQDPEFAEHNWSKPGMEIPVFGALEKLLHASDFIIVDTEQADANSNFYIGGDAPGMSWEGDELERLSDHRFVYKTDPSAGPFNFKIRKNETWQTNIAPTSNLRYEDEPLTINASF